MKIKRNDDDDFFVRNLQSCQKRGHKCNGILRRSIEYTVHPHGKAGQEEPHPSSHLTLHGKQMADAVQETQTNDLVDIVQSE